MRRSAGDGDALALAAGELHPALADMGVVPGALPPVLEAGDEPVGLRLPCGVRDLLLGGERAAVADVVADRAVEERGVLRHHADRGAKALLRYGRNVLASIRMRPLSRS